MRRSTPAVGDGTHSISLVRSNAGAAKSALTRMVQSPERKGPLILRSGALFGKSPDVGSERIFGLETDDPALVQRRGGGAREETDLRITADRHLILEILAERGEFQSPVHHEERHAGIQHVSLLQLALVIVVVRGLVPMVETDLSVDGHPVADIPVIDHSGAIRPRSESRDIECEV